VGNVKTEHHHYLIDEEGRPSGQPMTAVWQHRYDELGNRIQTTRPDGHTTTWLTYGSGHVHGLMLDDMEALQIERDDLHREVKRTQANEVAQEQHYDPAGRLKVQVLSRVERLGQSGGGSAGGSANASALDIQREYSYDRAGQLTDIGDSRRGSLSYRYDPVGRLLQAQSQLGTETFAFDPASNILDPTAPAAREAGAIHNIPAILNNLVKDYAGTHFEYDSRGNMVERLHNGQRTRFRWDAFGRLTEARTQETRTSFLYDPLGRRIAKRSEPIVITSSMDGSRYHAAEYGRQVHARGLGMVLFGWDGDQMAWETDSARHRTVHYVFEPHSFVPLLQGSSQVDMRRVMLQRSKAMTQSYVDAQGNYDLDQDPLYNGMYEPGFDENGDPPAPLESIHYYQCDHLGTPMELTDEDGNIAWEANYKAWGEARLTISETARKAGLKNPIRFQGQYLDEETGLHYNRYRYYDPASGRFVSKDPIGLAGGLNLHGYAPNPAQWIDPIGLCPCPCPGTATVHHYEGDRENPFGHYSIQTSGDARPLHTHQVVFDNGERTAISSNNGAEGSSMGTVALPNSAGAQTYQRKMMGHYTGKYDRKSNSCVTHVAEVLRQGGIDIPRDAKGEFKAVSNLAKGRK